LYRFDTLDDSADTLDGEVMFDSSGNGLDFVRTMPFGSLSLSSSTPPAAPAGSFVINSAASGIDTPDTGLFSIGRTGQLTVEFRYKPQTVGGLTYVLSQEDGNNAWGLYQTPAVNGNSALAFYAHTSGGQYREVVTPNVFNLSSGWSHVAVTINSSGNATFYQNGTAIGSAGGFVGLAPVNSTLRLGSENPSGNRVTSFLMDDLRISDVALPSGAGNGVNQLAWNTTLSLPPAPVNRPANFGTHWVRNNDFTTSAWGFTDYPTLYTDAHFNGAFGGGYQSLAAAGVTPMYVGAMTTLNDTSKTEIQVALNRGTSIFLLRDEMPLSEAAGFKQVSDYIRSIDDDAMILLGLAASSPEYVDQAITAAQPDAVIHGFYPYVAGDSLLQDYWYRGGLSDVALIRDRALFYDVPYFAYVQSFDDQQASANPPEYRRRMPSESELRAELFTKLSAGVKGFAYFVFQDGLYEDVALVSPAGVTHALYPAARDANREVANLGRVLRHLESTDWRFRSRSGHATPDYMTVWNANAGDGLLDVFTISGSVQPFKDALIGYFEDELGQDYFMLVNAMHGKTLSAANAAVSFVLTFDASVNELLRINRLTGEPEKLILNNHVLNLTLPGGTGDLFKYNTGDFAGIPGGDADLDGDVDLSDLSVLAGNYGIAQNGRWSLGDFDFDGDVDLNDLSRLAGNYGMGQAQAFADFQSLNVLPEPSTALLLMALTALGRRVRI
jgi:hypothetical protein